ncbi:MAG: hypothetical protein ACR2JB_06035 [Bryobacteraceae bacterium]
MSRLGEHVRPDRLARRLDRTNTSYDRGSVLRANSLRCGYPSDTTGPRAHLPRLLKRGGAVLAALFVIVGILLATHWPFTRQATIYSLERVSSSEVHMGRFRKIFFPHPGYVIENLSLTRQSGPGTPSLVSVRRMTCRGSWFAVLSFTHRVKQMHLKGLHVYIPAHIPPPVRSHPSAKIQTTVTEIIADGAILEIASDQPNRGTLRFDFSRLAVSNVARNKSMHFRTVMHNPQPPGDITATGAFGPLR